MQIKDLFEKWSLTGLKVKTPILEMEWQPSKLLTPMMTLQDHKFKILWSILPVPPGIAGPDKLTVQVFPVR